MYFLKAFKWVELGYSLLGYFPGGEIVGMWLYKEKNRIVHFDAFPSVLLEPHPFLQNTSLAGLVESRRGKG